MWLRGRQVAGLRKNPDCYFELLKFFNSVGSSSFVNYDVIFFSFRNGDCVFFLFVCFFNFVFESRHSRCDQKTHLKNHWWRQSAKIDSQFEPWTSFERRFQEHNEQYLNAVLITSRSCTFLLIREAKVSFFFFSLSFRDAPEATGDEPEDADFETPKVYELVQYETITVDLNEAGREPWMK